MMMYDNIYNWQAKCATKQNEKSELINLNLKYWSMRMLGTKIKASAKKKYIRNISKNKSKVNTNLNNNKKVSNKQLYNYWKHANEGWFQSLWKPSLTTSIYMYQKFAIQLLKKIF